MEVRLRAARREDCATIARLFQISSEGVADYVWSGLARPGEDLLAVGARRYARETADLSYNNALLAVAGEAVLGMAVAYPLLEATPAAALADLDPVLRPYALLERVPSLYLASLALFAPHRRRGIGSRLLRAVHERARAADLPEVSLLVFAANADAVRFYRRHGHAVLDRGAIVAHPLIRARGEVLSMAAPA